MNQLAANCRIIKQTMQAYLLPTKRVGILNDIIN
jgi:hypothetical protein